MTDLHECLDFYTQPELLEGDQCLVQRKNKRKRRCIEKDTILEFSDILAFNFNRYTPDGMTKIK